MRLFIGCPSYKREHPAHAASRFFTWRHFGPRASYRVLPGDSSLVRARATLFAAFLRFEEEWTHFLQVDDDQSWDPAHLEKLVALDLPLVGLRCAFRSDAPEYAGRCTTRWLPGPIKREADDTAAAKYLGGGFILWRRDVLEKMMAAFPELAFMTNSASHAPERAFAFWCERVVDGELLSEDYAACDLAARVGVTPRVWLGACSPHWNPAHTDAEGVVHPPRAFVPQGYSRPELKFSPDGTTLAAELSPPTSCLAQRAAA